jgi:hypothetical protein
MISTIYGIGEALKNNPIDIKITLPKGTLKIGDQAIPFIPELSTVLRIGGEGTGAKPVNAQALNNTVTNKTFNSAGGNTTGSGYPNGNDPTNDPGGGSSSKAEKTNYDTENSDAQLEALERLREVNEREAELIGKLPEEIRPFFEMANLAEKMGYEYQEIQINKNKLGFL